MEKSETELLLKGYGLTTAEMIYRMPDYTSVLNTFVWQEYDLAPITQRCSNSSNSGNARSRGSCTRSDLPIENC